MATKKSIILIVEDDELLLRALYLVFHNSNYTIATAPDGDTGLKMAQRLKPNIVLLDLLLPKMNGFDFLKYIKADPKLKDIPVIVLSNISDTEKVKEAQEIGNNEYLIKADWNVIDVAKKIKDILGL